MSLRQSHQTELVVVGICQALEQQFVCLLKALEPAGPHAVALTAKDQNLMSTSQPFAQPALSYFLLECACKTAG